MYLGSSVISGSHTGIHEILWIVLVLKYWGTGGGDEVRHDVCLLVQVTQFQLRKQQEEDGSKREEQSKVIKATERKEIDEETYVALVDQKNLNREEGVASARNVDEAIHAVAGANEEVDQHPER